MKVAILTTDVREHKPDYGNPNPYFSTFIDALLEGFQQEQGVELHIVSCLKRPVASPQPLARNITYHGLLVPSIGWLILYLFPIQMLWLK